MTSTSSPEEELRARRAALRAQLEDPGGDAVGRLRELASVDAAIQQQAAARRAAEMEGLARVHDAMSRLREYETPEALIATAPVELCTACGFTRAMISRVQGAIWTPVALEVQPGGDPQEAEFREYAEHVEIPLEHMLLETDLVRRRRPALVTDPEHNPGTFKDMIRVGRVTSYVVAPIMPTRRVIGFLHADRFGQERECDAHDRELLWAFAEHFGLLFDAAVLAERLEDQRRKIHDAFVTARTAIDALSETELALVRGEPAQLVASRPQGRREGGSRIESLLTARELDVVDLMVQGATNAEIARQLVVSEGTVKSHVKRILRKLHVGNRSEAVAAYLRIVRLDEARR